MPASTGTPQNEITGSFVIVLPPVRGGCRVLLTPTIGGYRQLTKTDDYDSKESND
jgi:hypothetical protein